MRRHRQSLWTNRKLSLVVSSLLGIFFLLITAVLISGFAFLFISDFRLLRLISLIPVITGAFSGAFICGKYRPIIIINIDEPVAVITKTFLGKEEVPV